MKINNKYLIIMGVFFVIATILFYNDLSNKKVYSAKDFNIKVIKSEIDYNNNGIDDYSDFVIGARKDATNKPTYKSAYYGGGYPPENEGVCTDTIWRAFKEAGYLLKDMIDEDIKNNEKLYPGLDKVADPNIDFRRVPNLKVFFDRHAMSLTKDPKRIEEWQPGDVVIFGKNYKHIAIVSDKRNKKGIPFIIHNAGQRNREENALLK
ncbi:MAG: DUF1287 domain-containing protein [Bacilli bacterium]|nr:DUF1287 domain-containing protein [Bacilli bacterium]